MVEEFFSSVRGPPLASNTAVARDVGIYAHTLRPGYSVTATFKKSSTAASCLAASSTHLFAAQHDKAYVHVYSRLRGNQEAFVALPERIRCVALAGDVLVLGTADGRLMLWETLTGRLVTTPPCHVQAVSCLAVTPYHVLSGSDDSNVHVWALPRLLELDAAAEHEPVGSLSNHRAAVTALAVSRGSHPDTSICVSASKDKTCIIWNYQAGVPLRTLLFPAPPMCLVLDPAARALCVSSDDGSLHLVELMAGETPLLGPHSAGDASAAVQVSSSSPFGLAPSEAGPPACLALSYDGTMMLSGHPRGQILQWALGDNSLPTELANLNAAVTNLVFVPPLSAAGAAAAVTPRPQTVVKPAQAARNYSLTAQFEADLGAETRFHSLLNLPGFSADVLANAIASLTNQPAGDPELQSQNDELWEIIAEQRKLYKDTLQRYAEAKKI